MNTTSEQVLRAALRNKLMAASDGTGTMAAAMGGTARWYQNRPPATAVFPYGIIRILANGGSAGQTNPKRFERMVEATVLGRPEGSLPSVLRIGDLVEATFLNLADGTGDGLVRFTGYDREELPAGVGDADSTVVQERHTAPFYFYRPA